METILGRTDLPDGPVGESWEVVDTADRQSVIETGLHAGRTLGEVRAEEGLPPFPLLLKVLDAQEHLSVQVHPDGADGLPPKEEAWIALAGGGSVAVGTPDAGLAPEAMLAALDELPLHGGDAAQSPTVVHVPPGTVHAILAGAFVFEVQNPVDITWRLYDHGRTGLDGAPRELHMEQAAGVLARGAPAAQAIDGAERTLRGSRFMLRLLAPGRHEGVQGDAVFLPAGGSVAAGPDVLAVPVGRTAVLGESSVVVESTGWSIACAGV